MHIHLGFIFTNQLMDGFLMRKGGRGLALCALLCVVGCLVILWLAWWLLYGENSEDGGGDQDGNGAKGRGGESRAFFICQ